MTSGATDEDLVRDCLQGETYAFETLVERYRGLAYRICHRMVGDHHAAEDLSQEAFLRAHRGLASFRGDSTFRSWFLQIVANLCLTWRQSMKRAPESLEQGLEIASPGMAPTGELTDLQRRVAEAILRLPEKQRLTLILRVNERLDFDRISEITGSTIGTARANLSHARQALRDLMAPWMKESKT
jgi:RNA polymerase sigma-70 factor (ECF subfamily)